MAYWYNAGTISVTNGSATVTGAGTEFVANLRTGDGLLAPDGRLYLIQNIASDTQLSIARNYLGPNVSGSADWWGVPVQGYVRDLADRVQQLIADASNVLDVINTYGNVVTRDVGTGANQVPLNSNLGSAATADTGTSAANVPTIAQADARYLGIGNKAADADKLDGADSAAYAKLAGNENITGTWDYDNMPTVGGAGVVESGSNANGSYVKFADGTMICSIIDMKVPYSAGWRLFGTWAYPHPFISASVSIMPSLSPDASGLSTAALQDLLPLAYKGADGSSGRADVRISTGSFSTGDYAYMSLHAIGRWKP